MPQQLRIWHTPNPPQRPFNVPVADVEHALVLLELLAKYDLYLGDGLVFANAQGLEMFEDGEWVEYYDDEGNDISEIRRKLEAAVKEKGERGAGIR